MLVTAYIIVGIYLIALVYITAYCLLQFQLLYYYKKHHLRHEMNARYLTNKNHPPVVTIQLPLYNEMYVVERLIDNIVKIQYPKEYLEIQVLDDSTDETTQLALNKAKEYSKLGFDIKVIRRPHRKGFKAGALKYGMKTAKGEFIAIFDADFLPKEDFLQKTIPYFDDPKIGVVQTRWEHINRDYSVLTKLQAFQLNVHFTVEQQGRNAGNYMLQFNGTAGIWRRVTIESSGGWEADTLTEDLDLSYRAQLKGWKIKYLEEVGSPAELPAEMNGLKSQQYRWMKGGAETAKKILPSLWKSDLSLWQKVHATGHLFASSIFIFVFLTGVFSVPLLPAIEILAFNKAILSVFLLSLVSIIIVYYVANEGNGDKPSFSINKLFKFIILFPIFLSLSMGLSLHNTVAVIQGFIGKKTPFVRTPKFNIQTITDSVKKKQYLINKLKWTTLVEGMLAVYFFAGIVLGIYLGNTSFLIFHILLMFGYGTIFLYTIRHLRLK